MKNCSTFSPTVMLFIHGCGNLSTEALKLRGLGKVSGDGKRRSACIPRNPENTGPQAVENYIPSGKIRERALLYGRSARHYGLYEKKIDAQDQFEADRVVQSWNGHNLAIGMILLEMMRYTLRHIRKLRCRLAIGLVVVYRSFRIAEFGCYYIFHLMVLFNSDQDCYVDHIISPIG